MNVAEMRMDRSMSSVTKEDKITDEYEKGNIGVL